MKKLALFAIIGAFALFSGCVNNEAEPGQLAPPPEPEQKPIKAVDKIKTYNPELKAEVIKPKKELEQKVEGVKEVPKL